MIFYGDRLCVVNPLVWVRFTRETLHRSSKRGRPRLRRLAHNFRMVNGFITRTILYESKLDLEDLPWMMTKCQNYCHHMLFVIWLCRYTSGPGSTHHSASDYNLSRSLYELQIAALDTKLAHAPNSTPSNAAGSFFREQLYRYSLSPL